MMLDPCEKFFAPLLIAVLLVGLSTPSSATPIAHLVLHYETEDFFIVGGKDFDVTYIPESSRIFDVQAYRTLPSLESPDLLRFIFQPDLPPGTAPDLFALLFFGTEQLGIPLQPDLYLDAAAFRPNRPTIDIGFSHLGCDPTTGNFQITNLSYLPDDSVNSFAANFEIRCDGGLPFGLSGTFAYSLSGDLPNPVVPEPSTWLLLSSAIAGLAFVRKKLANF